ncbi:MAG: cache domain-containing protein [Proteobacteria bacterium]|nr:cache domain-containing protein [Pseudomonadota bacterium]
MIQTARILLCLATFVFATLPPAFAAAADSPEPRAEQADDAVRAKALLERAVIHLKEQGERAYAAFSRAGEFTDGDLYVYVVGNDGVLLASGGASFNFIGRNMLEYRDPDGKKLFQEMLDRAKSKGSGRIEYRWLNLQRGIVERKVAYYQAVDNRIVAVGYYVPRATPEQAKALLWRAVDELKRSGTQAFQRFNDLNGGFVQDDSYVFVVGLKDLRMHAHGAMPRLVGRNVSELLDANGKPIMRPMIDIVTSKGEGSFDYQWRNPVTGKIEGKRTFLQRVGDYMIGVGYYQP